MTWTFEVRFHDMANLDVAAELEGRWQDQFPSAYPRHSIGTEHGVITWPYRPDDVRPSFFQGIDQRG